MIKQYLYTLNKDDPAIITYDDVENTIRLHKDSQPMDILLTKHSTYTMKNEARVARIGHDKAKNYVKDFKKNIIEKGIRDGVCKAM